MFFSHPPLPLFLKLLCLLLCITIVVYCLLLLFSTKLLALYDGLGLGLAGGARGWVAGRVGFWDVLATWVWGWQLQPLGSWAPNLHVQLRH